MDRSLTGIAASSGIAFGKAYKLVAPDLSIKKEQINDTDQEINKLQVTLNAVRNELQCLRKKVASEQGEENAAIFDAHLLMVDDIELISAIEKKINDEHINVESAVKEVKDSFVALFEQMENEYMRERATDVQDVTNRVLAHLLGQTLPNLSSIEEKSIIIATDLTPSETAQINTQYVQGFVTDYGGKTSHSAIIARALEIPAIVGTKHATTLIEHGDEIIVDGKNGKVFINPPESVRLDYEKQLDALKVRKKQLALLRDVPTVTRDGVPLELAANIGSPHDLEQVHANGAEGIGLYRTEFLYMEETNFPTEEQQFTAYKAVLEHMGEKPVVVRTLDIGGDKHLPYWQRPEEMNPFLGLRAIRLMLKETDIFRTQLRALLRASVYGNLKIMFPMIATLEEFKAAKQVLLEEKQRLLAEGFAVADKVEIGMMVEIPSTAVIADVFASEVDFFSIGTNDLIQYTFAADRMNEDVAHLYQPLHPAILRLIKSVIDAAHAQDKWVGMCGEMAGDLHAIPLLVGLGLDEFSMSATSILSARDQIQHLTKKDLASLANEALTLQTAQEVFSLVQEKMNFI